MNQPSAFSWGYWGWGSHTSDLVHAVDVVEHDRGRAPPVFADIRFSRSVRATGFRDSAFAETVGPDRYRWIKNLGNANIGIDASGPRILEPDAGIEELLSLIVDADRQHRSAIFFCACEWPCHCHRAIVAGLLHKAAVRKHIPLTVVEWPGGEPVAVRLSVSEQLMRTVLRGGSRVSLKNESPERLRELMALPWCSRVDLSDRDTLVAITSGPAHKAADWYLPVLEGELIDDTNTGQALNAAAIELRQSLGYAALS